MPRGLNRAGDFRDGTPITLPHEFGNPVNWMPDPAHFGNPMTSDDPTQFGNPVNWPTPDPAHFGNPVGSVMPPVQSGFELEGSSGVILLEDGSILLLEIQ